MLDLYMTKITPFLWFDNQAEEAAKFYTSIFKNSQITLNTPMIVEFVLDGQSFKAINGGPNFKFTAAISMFVDCADQDEVDFYWEKFLSTGGRESECGWLWDNYGLSWQIIPRRFMELMSDPDQEKTGRVMQAMLKMKKLNVAELEKAFLG